MVDTVLAQAKTSGRLNSNQLKLIAIIAMTTDQCDVGLSLGISCPVHC